MTIVRPGAGTAKFCNGDITVVQTGNSADGRQRGEGVKEEQREEEEEVARPFLQSKGRWRKDCKTARAMAASVQAPERAPKVLPSCANNPNTDNHTRGAGRNRRGHFLVFAALSAMIFLAVVGLRNERHRAPSNALAIKSLEERSGGNNRHGDTYCSMFSDPSGQYACLVQNLTDISLTRMRKTKFRCGYEREVLGPKCSQGGVVENYESSCGGKTSPFMLL